jgi:hypothetical protein
MQLENAKTVEQIRAAFPTLPIDAEGAFAQCGASYPDARQYMERLQGKTWDQLDRAYIVRRSDALGFLGTRHLVAVLPAYLCALVEDGVWSLAAGMLTLILAKPISGTDSGLGVTRFDALTEALTGGQRAAVAAALRAFAESDEDGSLGQAARAALDGHWSRLARTLGDAQPCGDRSPNASAFGVADRAIE